MFFMNSSHDKKANTFQFLLACFSAMTTEARMWSLAIKSDVLAFKVLI